MCFCYGMDDDDDYSRHGCDSNRHCIFSENHILNAHASCLMLMCHTIYLQSEQQQLYALAKVKFESFSREFWMNFIKSLATSDGKLARH